jgi:ferredoxin
LKDKASLKVMSEETCLGCRKYEDVCPEEAISIKGIILQPESLTAELKEMT